MAEEKSSRWYNSGFFNHVGEGIAISGVLLALLFGVKHCMGPQEMKLR